MITFEQVLDAYQKTGLIPCAGHAGVMHNECCAIGAIFNLEDSETKLKYNNDAYVYCEEKYDILYFTVGFDDGFSKYKVGMKNEKYLHAYELGQKIRLAVLDGKLPKCKSFNK